MTDALSKFLGDLQQEGALSESAAGFTLRTDKAREKLQKFALEHPESYFLLIVGALHTLGGRHFRLRVDADDLEVSADAQMERAHLRDLWSYVAGGSKLQRGEGLRLLAMAVLTSVRFDSVDWRLVGTDAEGGFEFVQSIKKGQILDSQLSSHEGSPGGVQVFVKRKSLGQIARRFFSQLADRLTSHVLLERKVLSERLFMGVFKSFEVNGEILNCDLSEDRALAVGRTPEAPNFLERSYSFELAGELPVVAVITSPGEQARIPGKAGEICWIWHGLTMGQSSLKMPYPFCRAFLCADHLSTDLGLSAIPDTWEKSNAERVARDAVRDVLHLLAQDYLQRQYVEQKKSVSEEVEAILLDVMADRIQTSRTRRRLASFNRDLIACPIFWASDEHGAERRYSLAEIWERWEKGLKTACFATPQQVRSVPAWPGRPLVVMAGGKARETLDSLFGPKAILSGEKVLADVERVSARMGSVRPQTTPAVDAIVAGTFDWQGTKVEWKLCDSKENRPKGQLLVTRGGRLLFEDSQLDLPAGLVIQGEFPWLPDYQGRLAQKSKLGPLLVEVMMALVRHLEGYSAAPGAEQLAVYATVWRLLVPQLAGWGPTKPEYSIPWLLTYRQPEGWLSRSPAAIFDRQPGPPLYRITIDAARSFSPPVSVAEYVVIGPGASRHLKTLGARPLLSINDLKKLLERPPADLDEENFWTVPVPDDALKTWSREIQGAAVGFPFARGGDEDVLTVESNLWGHSLCRQKAQGFLRPATVVLHWHEGWPGAKAAEFAEAGQAKQAQEIAVDLTWWAARELLAKADFSLLQRLHPKTVASAWFEVWTDGRFNDQELFLVSSGMRVSIDAYLSCFQALYFTDLSEIHRIPKDVEALWIPPEVSETLVLLSDSADWKHWSRRDEFAVVTDKDRPAEVLLAPAESPESSRSAPPKSSTKLKTTTSGPVRHSGLPRAMAVSEGTPEVAEAKPKVPEMRPKGAEVEPEVTVAGPGKPKPTPAPVAASVPLAEGSGADSAGPGDSHLPSYHRFLLEQYRALDFKAGESVPGLFEEYLKSLSWPPAEISEPLLAADGSVRQGKVTQALSEGRVESALFLLSALFSVFNRKLEEVDDTHERRFHQALLQRCEDLYGKRPMTSL